MNFRMKAFFLALGFKVGAEKHVRKQGKSHTGCVSRFKVS